MTLTLDELRRRWTDRRDEWRRLGVHGGPMGFEQPALQASVTKPAATPTPRGVRGSGRHGTRAPERRS